MAYKARLYTPLLENSDMGRAIKSLLRGDADGEPVTTEWRILVTEGHKEIGDTVQALHRVVTLCLAHGVTYKKARRLLESDSGLQGAEWGLASSSRSCA